MHIERVTYNKELVIKKWIPSLQEFYFNALLPKLACPRHQQGGIREPEDWLGNSSDEWQNKVSNM